MQHGKNIIQEVQTVTVCRKIRYFALTDDECFYHSFKRLLFSRFKTLLPFLKIFSSNVFTSMLARVLVMALCPSVCVCLSQVGVLSKRMN